MSVFVSSDVWEHSKATGAPFVVLLCLADQANDDGESWYSVDKIAARCRMSRRSVFRHLEELEGLQELERTERPGRSSLFKVKVGRTATRAKLAPPTGDRLAHPGVPTVAQGCATAGTHNHHSPSVEPSESPRARTRKKTRAGGAPTADRSAPSGYTDWSQAS